MVFFDFDGTLIRGDSGWRFLAFCFGRPRLVKLAVLTALTWAQERIPGSGRRRRAYKEIIFDKAFRGHSYAWLADKGEEFAKGSLPGLALEEPRRALSYYLAHGVPCVLVSASLETYLKPWAAAQGFQAVLGTRLAFSEDGLATGAYAGRNCVKAEKVERIRDYLAENARSERTAPQAYAYGNGPGDYAMLAWAGHGWLADKAGRLRKAR